MRFSMRRHIGSLFSPPPTAGLNAFGGMGTRPPFEGEFAPRDYVAFLLHMDSQIEHGLMVQYLFAAYTLGGPQVPDEHRDTVRSWREIMLGVAKEEMGHLITVQNVLRLIGAPLSLERDDYPWSSPFYPFPFSLEPLTLDSLAKYIYAESPEDWSGPLADEIRKRVKKTVENPLRVGQLFKEITDRVSDPSYLHDDIFQAATTEYQADFPEWGRGYQAGKRGNASGVNPKGTPDLIVVPLWSRGEAVSALTRIAEQGEAPPSDAADAPSHFARFLTTYEAMSAMDGSWNAALPIATNPYVALDEQTTPLSEETGSEICSAITHPQSKLWAQFHNVRYRMLLTFLDHSFYTRAAALGGTRGILINAAFGEMYNLRAIAETLMRLPLRADGTGRAGPPFQMPYILHLPMGDKDKWRTHRDLIDASMNLIKELQPIADDQSGRFLAACLDADEQLRAIIDRQLDASVRQ